MVTSEPTQPTLRPLDENLNLAEVTVAIVYLSERLPGSGGLVIRPGTRTDGASIPWGFWWLVGHPSTLRYQRATLLHDVLYARTIGTRKDADLLFRDLLRQNGVSWFRRWTMWAALRAFGGYFWEAARMRQQPRAQPPPG